MDEKARRNLGAHYTSEANIVIFRHKGASCFRHIGASCKRSN
jgi:hypothetical protein